MDVFGFLTLVVVGFTACAEFGSFAFVHPVLRHLPSEHHLRVEQGLLRTFGRVMPVLMTLSVVLSISYAVQMRGHTDPARLFYWASAACIVAALISTLIFNVPVNLATGRWDAARLEGNSQPLGIFPRGAVVAFADRLRAPVFGRDVAVIARNRTAEAA